MAVASSVRKDHSLPSGSGATGLDIVVMSIGRASAHHISALSRVLGLPQRDLADRILRAPSVLVSGLEPGQSEQLLSSLAETGLELRALPPGQVPAPDPRRHDLAIRVTRLEALPQVLGDLSALLAAPPEAVRDILLRDPATFLGDVSTATVEALRHRLERPGVVVQSCDMAGARYDLLADGTRAGSNAQLRALADQMGLRLGGAGAGPILASDLDAACAMRLAGALSQAGSGAWLLNRAFNWFELRLLSAPDTPALRDLLTGRLGIPDPVLGRVLGALPVVIAPQLPAQEAQAVLARLTDLGARAEAALLATRRFGLRLRKIGAPQGTDQVLAGLGQVTAGDRQRLLSGQQETIPGPYTLLRMRWLQRDLAAQGTLSDAVAL